jgi:membrane protease YdiL (CAAX protease family)
MTNIPSKRLIILQIFLIFILPVFLLYFNIVPPSWRFFFLSLGALAIYGIIIKEQWTHEEMGIRHDNFWKSLPYYVLFTLISVLFLFLLDRKVNVGGLITQRYFFQTLILFLPISFFQEFAFRSFLIPRLKLIFSHNFTIILVNTILFTIIHVIYPSLIVSLPLSFLGGLFFTWLYLKHPNLLLISLAHAVTNVVAVLLGFFTIQ